MDLKLKRLRTQRGISQEEMAAALDIKVSRYGSWERGDRMLSLAQACQCAEILDCSLDELAGRETPSRARAAPTDPFAAEVLECYEASSPEGKNTIVNVARSTRLLTGEAAERPDVQAQGRQRIA